MKILIIWAENVERHIGGSVHFWGLMHGIKLNGWQVRAIVPAYGRRKMSDVEDVSFVSLPRRCLFSFLLLQIVTVFCMPYWLLRYQPEVVYVRACFLAFLMRLICRLAGIPLIMEVDTIVDKEAEMRGRQKILVGVLKVLGKLNCRFVDGMVCVTDGIREEMIRRGADPEITVVIHNASRTDIMQPIDQRQARRQLGLVEDSYIVGFMGTFAPWQGLDLLVQAAKHVVDSGQQSVRFILVGDGQCHEQLEQMIGQLGLNRFFSFFAPVPYQQVSVFNSACDVVVNPVYDPRRLRFGLSPLKFWDAVSVGVPVLVPEGSQLEGVLRQLSLPGVFSAGDKKDLAESILNVLAQTKHHLSRRRDVHLMVAKEYSWNRVAERLLELCCRVRQRVQER
jgi:glycosyltransferase involved in cell wall biosynthesis